METGLVVDPDAEPFPYIPAGLTITKGADGSVKKAVLTDGSPLDDTTNYTVAMDQGAFTEELGREGSAVETSLIVNEVVADYLAAHSPVTALNHSVN